jgi:uncharacterized membrane protein YhhN
MSRMEQRPPSTRSWLSGLVITVTTIVALFGFWRLAPVVTFLVACFALAALVVALWIAGGPTNQPSDR